jgi:hypothetical protein
MNDIFAHIASFTAKTVPPIIPIVKVVPPEKINYATNSLGILCFSKDRPFQLEQFILSLKKYVQSAIPLQIVILYSPGLLYSSIDLFCLLT